MCDCFHFCNKQTFNSSLINDGFYDVLTEKLHFIWESSSNSFKCLKVDKSTYSELNPAVNLK